MTQPAPLRAPLECPSLRSVLVAHHRACVATIGTFDGVHPGHRALIAHAHRLARARGLNLTAVTFSPRPDQVLRPQRALPDLCSLPERLLRLRLAGADDVVVVPFSHAIAEMSAETFVTHLRRDLGAQALCVGEDFALGRHRRGDVNALSTMGIEVDTFPLQAGVDGRKISSSAMRAAIELARAPGAFDSEGSGPGMQAAFSGAFLPTNASLTLVPSTTNQGSPARPHSSRRSGRE